MDVTPNTMRSSAKNKKHLWNTRETSVDIIKWGWMFTGFSQNLGLEEGTYPLIQPRISGKKTCFKKSGSQVIGLYTPPKTNMDILIYVKFLGGSSHKPAYLGGWFAFSTYLDPQVCDLTRLGTRFSGVSNPKQLPLGTCVSHAFRMGK